MSEIMDFIITSTLQDGGCSITPGGDVPDSGYMVALPNAELVLDSITESQLSAWLDLLSLTDSDFIGTWLNREDGKVYLDVSRNVPSREVALRLAKEWSQLAIWDVKRKESIYL